MKLSTVISAAFRANRRAYLLDGLYSRLSHANEYEAASRILVELSRKMRQREKFEHIAISLADKLEARP